MKFGPGLPDGVMAATRIHDESGTEHAGNW
jgi:hypothetical protein